MSQLLETDAHPSRPGREGWAPLPRRPKPRRTSALLTIRTSISNRSTLALGVVSLALPVIVWVAVWALGVVPGKFLPSPASVLDAGLEMAKSGELFTDLWATVQRVLLGFGLAVLVSVPLGLVMGTFAAGQALFGPVISVLRYLPASAFIPLLIIWLGIGEPSKVLLLFIATVFFNTLMTADAVRRVPRAMIDVSYTLGARRGEVLRKVIVPYSLPGMLDAIRVNAAAAWNFVVVAELIAATEGLGYRIVRAQRFTQTDKIFAVLIVIGIAGVTFDVMIRLLRDRVGRWSM
ncbi:ABC-type nitrate/sulfonate/bicarbonate transport system, permease component [Alloactinosynnema sp. L-07]|uniref:ABC transporter permease n=1 Tax=Alloactinosynnema sp. L-07 TaxID=1653480 RepID=UPI00065F021F|nr:ABC transporter permease [Alloactinosynnema sp. L-07]CRK60169.1 ABC-type nitrate/sulfonate/bicarbonate transport system, permease component [Alloactinosynnema sp. L-07]